MGYDRDFTYKIYHPDTKKMVISRDIVSDETKPYYEKKNSLETIDNFIDSFEREEEPVSDLDEDPEVNLVSFANIGQCGEPISYKQAINSNDSSNWKQAMLEEYNSLIKIETWELVQLPAGRTPVSCKWVFKLKLDKTGQVSRYKARLVARGFSQKYKIDYDETFSPTLRAETIRCLLILAFEYKLHMLQMDVKTAFLHGLLEEEIFMTQPEGYIKGNANMVCRLKKAIYGLKQASRSWNEVFTNFLKEFNLKQLYTDCCVFVNYNCNFNKGGTVLVVAIYVDDGLILTR